MFNKPSYEFPMVKLEIQGLKHQIIHAFADHNQELQSMVEAQLSAAIDNYPFEAEIQRLSKEVISDAIKGALEYYFKFGEGREVIKKSIIEALNKLYD